VLQRILQRFCEVVLGHLQVVLRSDRFRVPDPVTHHLNREIVSEFLDDGTFARAITTRRSFRSTPTGFVREPPSR
jgi:hypothetical protein